MLKKLKKFDYIIVTASTICCSIISFLYSIYTKKYIEPFEYGIYSTCTILQSYMGYAQLGVLSAYNRDLPQLLGADNTEAADKLRRVTLGYLLIIYNIITVVVFAIMSALLYRGGIDNRYLIGYIIIGITILLDNICSYSMYTARMLNHFNYSALVELIRACLAVMSAVIVIHISGYYGLYVRILASAVIGLVLYYRISLKKVKPAFDVKVLKISMMTGLPLMVNSFIYMIMSSVDKFVILIFMDTEALGIYSVPTMGFTTILLIPQTIGQIFYYKMSNLYGSIKSKEKLVDICNGYSKILAFCTCGVVVVVYCFLPVFVKYVMPMYIDGVKPAQVLILGVALYGAVTLYGNLFSILRWNKELIMTSVWLCVFNVFFSVGFVLLNGRDISNVAYGTSLSYAVYSLFILRIISRKMNYSFWKLIKGCYLYVVFTILSVILVYKVFPFEILPLILSLAVLVIEGLIMKPWRMVK